MSPFCLSTGMAVRGRGGGGGESALFLKTLQCQQRGESCVDQGIEIKDVTQNFFFLGNIFI